MTTPAAPFAAKDANTSACTVEDAEPESAFPSSSASSESSAATYQQSLEALLIGIWKKVLEVDRLGWDEHFLEIGGDSVLGVSLLLEIEAVLGVRLPVEVLVEAPTIRTMAQLLQSKGCSASRAPIVVLQRQGSKPPLFAIAPLGGHIVCYYPLVRCLGPEQPFYGLQLPQCAEGAAYPSVEQMASAMIQEIKKVQPDGPYYLAGYSYGGKMAFEVAQQLHAAGERVALLAMLDTYGPGFPKPRPALTRIWAHLEKAWRMGAREGARYLVQGLSKQIPWRNRGIAGPDGRIYLDEAHLTRARQQAWSQYRPRVYPGRVTLLRARQDPDWGWMSFADPLSGWGAWAGEGVQVNDIPGNHMNLLKAPHVEELARTLNACLFLARAVQSAWKPGQDAAAPRQAQAATAPA